MRPVVRPGPLPCALLAPAREASGRASSTDARGAPLDREPPAPTSTPVPPTRASGTLFYGNDRDRPVVGPADISRYLPVGRRHHYADGYSMAELAKLWASTDGVLPPSVASVVGDDRLLRGHFEYSVPVWGRGRSETDLMAFVSGGVVAVEGKTDEPFDELVEAWIGREKLRNTRSPAHRRAVAERYAEAFGVSLAGVLGVRYQLLHRTLSAALTALAADVDRAWMVVQSFPTVGRVPRSASQRADFERFVDLVGPAPVIAGRVVRLAWLDETVAPAPQGRG